MKSRKYKRSKIQSIKGKVKKDNRNKSRSKCKKHSNRSTRKRSLNKKRKISGGKYRFNYNLQLFEKLYK